MSFYWISIVYLIIRYYRPGTMPAWSSKNKDMHVICMYIIIGHNRPINDSSIIPNPIVIIHFFYLHGLITRQLKPKTTFDAVLEKYLSIVPMSWKNCFHPHHEWMAALHSDLEDFCWTLDSVWSMIHLQLKFMPLFSFLFIYKIYVTTELFIYCIVKLII